MCRAVKACGVNLHVCVCVIHPRLRKISTICAIMWSGSLVGALHCCRFTPPFLAPAIHVVFALVPPLSVERNSSWRMVLLFQLATKRTRAASRSLIHSFRL